MASNSGESSSNASNSGSQQPQPQRPDPNNFRDTGFTKKQYYALQAMLGVRPTNAPPNGPNSNPPADIPFGRPQALRADDIGFFNPGAEGDGPGVREKHITFRDVFAFIDRLKEMKRRFSEPEVLRLITSCLKGTAIT